MTSMGYYVDVPPRHVPGYADAVRAGTVHLVPTEPPQLLPGPTAEAMSNRFLIKLCTAFFGAIFFMLLLPDSATAGPAVYVVAALSLVGAYTAYKRLGVVGDRNVEEFERGYTTLRLIMGTFWIGQSHKRKNARYNIGWNYTGIWVLDKTGAVIQRPDPAVDGPGYYPSPNNPDHMELWTGEVWTGTYRL